MQNIDKDKDQLAKLPDEIRNATNEEIFNILASQLLEHHKNNQADLAGKTLEDIFYHYLQEKKDFIAEINQKLGVWNVLNFDKIKDLYVRWNHTLEQALTRDMLKRFERKDAVRSYVKIFEEKVNDILLNPPVSAPDGVNFAQFMTKPITKDWEIDVLFRAVNDELFQKTNSLDANTKEQIKRILLTNQELLDQMNKDKIINLREKQAIETDNFDSLPNDDLKYELQNIQETMFVSSVANILQDVSNTILNIQIDMNQMWNLGKVGDLFQTYSNPSTNDINDLWTNHVQANLSPSQQQEYIDQLKNLTWNAYNMQESALIEKFVKQRLQDKDNFENFVRNWTIHTQWDPNLADIVNDLMSNTLTPAQQIHIVMKLKSTYISSVTATVTRNFWLNQTEESEYKTMLTSLLDPTMPPSQLNIRGKLVNFSKVINFDQASTVEELLETVPNIDFTFTDNLDLFYDIFPEHFSSFNVANVAWWAPFLRKVSHFSKYKVHKNDWTFVEWYLMESASDSWKMEIYDKPFVKAWTVIATLQESEIWYIDLQDEKLELNSNNDLATLAKWFISTFPDHQTDLNALNLQHITSDSWENMNINVSNFKRERDSIEWDKNANFEVWTILQFKWINLPWPWIKNNRYYAEITEIDESHWYFRVKFHGWWLVDLDWQDDEMRFSMTWDILSKIKYANGGNVFKFNKISDWAWLQQNLDNLELKSDFASIESWMSHWRKNIEIKNNKIFKKNAEWVFQEVKYIWRLDDENINNADFTKKDKTIREKMNPWQIQLTWSDVVLSHPSWGVTKKIDLNTFLIIISQNWLFPWTEEEYDNQKKDMETLPNEKWSWLNMWLFSLRFFSFNNVSMSFKQIKDNFEYYRKEKQELQSAMMYESLTRFFPNTWVLGDIKMEATWEKESRIWKRIENAKARLDRSWEWKWKNHWKLAWSIIEKEIFDKMEKWKTLNYDMRLKAAWYLLYALESGGWAYFRSLSAYEWKWYWVKALLWESHHKKYQQTVSNLQAQLLQDPWNDALRQKLAKSEIWYIKEAWELSKFFSANFGGSIEWAYSMNIESTSKAKDTYESESARWDYYSNKDPMNGYMWNNMPPKVLWTLQAMAEAVDSHDKYVDFYKVVMNVVLSWYLFNNFPSAFKGQFEKLCRTYWIPFGLSPSKPDSLEKMLVILDYIAKQKNIKPWWKNSFTEYLYGINDSSKIDIYALQTKKTRMSIVSKMDEVWTMYGADIVNSLDYSDTDLLKYNTNPNITNKEKTVIAEYFGKVNDWISEDFGFNNDLFKTSYSPYYQNWIFNIPSITFRKIALNLEDWDFDSDGKWMAEWVWNSITNRLDGMSQLVHENEIYEFILQKYMNWLGRYYKWIDEIKLIKAIRIWDSQALNEIIVQYNKQNYWYNGIIPYEMEKWLKKFSEILQKRPWNIDQVLEKVFGKQKLAKSQKPIQQDQTQSQFDRAA